MAVRVRYAPSPTGRQHVGGVRTALFNYLLARATGGRFLLRIEDTDRTRFDAEGLDDIFATLRWIGLSWDEGPDVGGPHAPYTQSERVDRYRDAAQQLLESGAAYRCYCDAARLEQVRKSGSGYDRHCRDLPSSEHDRLQAAGVASVVRFRVPLEGTTAFEDQLLGTVSRQNSDISPDPVLLKSDGFPTYHLAAVVDDHAMQISHVLRSQEWVSSAPLHVLLFAAFGWEPPHYLHLPAVTGPDGKKLGKRHGATSIGEFRAQGYLPEALINYLALLGWSPGDDREMFSLSELEQSFSVERLNKAAGMFDHQKLAWYNGQYIRRLAPERLAELVRPYLVAAGLEAVADGLPPATLAELVQERLTLLAEASERLAFLGAEPALAAAELSPKRLEPAVTGQLLEAALPLVERIDPSGPHNDQAVEDELRELATARGVKFGDLMMALRMAATGTRVSPPLFACLRALGIARGRQRFERAIATLANGAAAGDSRAGSAGPAVQRGDTKPPAAGPGS